MISFDDAHRAVHYPSDRRLHLWVHPSILVAVAALVVVPFAIANIEWLAVGLPRLVPGDVSAQTFHAAEGFPAWVRYGHFFNFLFVTMLIRSGLSILADHPRLYLDDGCRPGSEWIRFTPTVVPKDRLWTAKDDARYLSPVIGLPGYRHTVGIARAWHFLVVYGYVLDGLVFVVLLFLTPQWRRLVPTSLTTFEQGWAVFVHYATLHLPPEPDGFYGYNALQQLTYFAMVFVFGPGTILTGLAMSPALVNHFPGYAKLFGGRQRARSIHFLWMLGFAAFIVVHVALVAMTGLARNMNHIVLGTDDERPLGLVLGGVGLAVVVLFWLVAHWVSWHAPRQLQRAVRTVNEPLLASVLGRLEPRDRYTEADISEHFWPNGKLPEREDWKRLAQNGFRDYALTIGGEVENPVTLTLADLKQMADSDAVTMHHCIQGWSGIARWSGVSMRSIVELVRPGAEVRAVVFHSFGAGLYTPEYYDTQELANVLRPECILALERNGAPLGDAYGAPLRLRVENQLGYKMVKWIERIDFVASVSELGRGEGGTNEDNEYYDLAPYI